MSSLTIGDKLIFNGDAIQDIPSGWKLVYGSYSGTSDSNAITTIYYNSVKLTSTNCEAIIIVGTGTNVPCGAAYVGSDLAWYTRTLATGYELRPSAGFSMKYIAVVSKSVFGD